MTDTPATGTEPATSESETGETGETATEPADLAAQLEAATAEVNRYKEIAQKNEKRAKANLAAARELEDQQRAAMTEHERAVADAYTRGQTETLEKLGSRLVAAEIRAASAGTDLDVDVLLDGVDPARFLDDDHEPDTKAIHNWVVRLAGSADETPPVGLDLGQGSRSSRTATAALNGDPLLRDLERKLGVRR